MQKITKSSIVRGTAKNCKKILARNDCEVNRNIHTLRACLLTVLSARREFADCAVEESGNLSIGEEAYDYCEVSRYDLSAESLNRFLSDLSHRRYLSYGEIACLIPTLIACSMQGYCDEKCDTKTFIRTLQVLREHDGSDLAERLSETEEVLRKDPVYPTLDKASKELYRKKIRALARKFKIDERSVAVDLLKTVRQMPREEDRQIGILLFPPKINRFYFPLLFLTSGIFLCILFPILKNGSVFFLSILPAFLCAKMTCDTVFSKTVKPKLLPKVKITEINCPKTLVTVVSLLQDAEDTAPLLHRLDILAHRISLKNVRIGLLLDLPPADRPLLPKEEEKIDMLREEIQKRNQNDNRFFCALRKRQNIPGEYRFEAPGRKQGAMMDFSDLIAGDRSAFLLFCGDIDRAKYMITLDTDTEPTPESVEGLIGFLEHPNNTPFVQVDKNGFSYVASGYGAAAPRIAANPATSHTTSYASLLGGNGGTELYHNPNFDLYQDLFGEGIFCGKGIINLSLYREVIANRFRNDPILSHDLPEGQFLRCASLSDLLFFDEIPDNVISDGKRTHRWIRGDFQNARFLSRKNNRSALFSFKVLHNLCRALFPTLCFSLMAFSPFLGICALRMGLIFTVFPLILSLPANIFLWLFRHRHIHPQERALREIRESFLTVVLLPSRGIDALDGAIRGIYRLWRGKKILEWTTAAHASTMGRNIGDYYAQLPAQLVGFPLLFFPMTAHLGLLWLAGPLIAGELSRKVLKKTKITAEFREDLSFMWRYYADFMNEENHYLPPDNYQQEPLNTVAHRTSPTNIGFGLLSVLGAHDLGLIGEEELFTRIESSLSTLESLPKWKGHLYNWYDTATCKVLPPKFISSVDCGNWAACLHALKNGIKEFSDPRGKEIVRRIENLLSAADFSVLYNKEKALFYIGYDLREGKMSEGCYDLFASEARLTSFYAVMTHQVPVSHWRHLSRPSKKYKGDLLVCGWSGTMFEYFMPHILLPIYRKTLGAEMLRGVLKAQIDYSGKKYPWGISESGYYGFDNNLNYQYRAFGIPMAALRRDHGFPVVVSPYSTFLAYPYFPNESERNRVRLPKGKYGYFEAVDYRLGDSNPRTVQSFMAHHLGMSFLSGVNAATDFIMQKRFMAGEGEAYRGLLTETAPTCVSNELSDPIQKGEPWQPPRQKIERPDPEHPNIVLLTNGRVSEVLSDSGIGYLKYDRFHLTAQSDNPNAAEGIFLFVRNKGELYGTTYAPLYPDKNQHRMFFDGGGATCYGTFRDFETRTSVTIPPDASVSVRELTVKNGRMTEESFEFILYLRPILCHQRDYEAHPEYKDLFTTAHYDEALRTVFFCRKEGEQELWIAVAASKDFTFNVRRDSFGNFDHIYSVVGEGARKHPIFPALVLRGVMSIRGRDTGSVRFYIASGNTMEEAGQSIRKVSSRDFDILRRRYEQACDAFCYSSDIRAADRLVFGRLASKLLLTSPKPAAVTKLDNNLPRRTLWKYGISGDNPILALRIGDGSVPRIAPFLKAIALFLRGNIEIDLVILFRESVGYHCPLRTALNELISSQSSELSHRVFPLNIHSVEEYLFFQKVSDYFINLERGWKLTTPHRSFHPLRRLPPTQTHEKLFPDLGKEGYEKDGSYLIQKNERTDYRCNHLILANPTFGTVLSDRSLGYTFARNASENRITPRTAANTRFGGGEGLYGIDRTTRYDLLSHASAHFYPHSALYEADFFGTRITVEVFIPKYLSAKIIRITVAQEAEKLPDIVYEPDVILGKKNRGTVNRLSEDGRVYFRNACNDDYGDGVAVLFGIRCTAEGSSLRFHPTAEALSCTFILAYADGQNSARSLADLLSDEGRISKELRKAKEASKPYLHLDTPDRELNFFVNGFLQQQILQSRLFGRTGPSQPGGAYGFRDQLQDSLCLAPFDSSLLKHQLIRCARCQFEEGDVLHWWHPRPHGRVDGLRSRFSDDPLWLVFACAEYRRITDDASLFRRTIPYLSAPPLEEDEQDRYFTPANSSKSETLFHHAMRAYRYALRRGDHGLILFGSGDWNDGMNHWEAGSETVWGSMFALLCAENFLPLAQEFGDEEDVAYLTEAATELRSAIEKTAWSAGRYLRGFRGSRQPYEEEGIDLLPQAFAQFCNLKHWDLALSAAVEELWDPNRKILRLLRPPYTPKPDGFPGSIADYPPGVRENGGQYTHGALWLIKALYLRGEGELATEMLCGIHPLSHCHTAAEREKYGGEPYVLSADVYTLPDREGMGGWSYYTGAAGWYLNIVTEHLLGIRRQGRCVSIQPNLPKNWNGCKFEIRVEDDTFRITVSRGTEKGLYEDDRRCERLLLTDSHHEIRIIV